MIFIDSKAAFDGVDRHALERSSKDRIHIDIAKKLQKGAEFSVASKTFGANEKYQRKSSAKSAVPVLVARISTTVKPGPSKSWIFGDWVGLRKSV